MTHPIRSTIVLPILLIVLVACGSTAGAPTSEAPAPSLPAAPSDQPSVEPSGAPAEGREIAGTITVFEGTFSGPGGTIQEALDNGPTGNEIPTLVNGVMFRDTDGTIYLATSVSDVDVPTFDGPMLLVLNTPNDGPSWDMENAALLGLEEARGIVFRRGAQVLGFLELP